MEIVFEKGLIGLEQYKKYEIDLRALKKKQMLYNKRLFSRKIVRIRISM